MHLTSKFIAIFSILFFIASCGYVGEKPIESKVVYETTDLATCDIDADAFSEMMERNIDDAISCLEQNFRDFQKGVEHDGSGDIDRSIISTFINRFMSGERSSILNSLDVLFKINMIILKDKPDFISSSNIANISKLLLITNHSAVKVKRIIDALDKMNENYTLGQLKELRADFKSSIESFSNGVATIINSTMGSDQTLNLTELIDDIAEMVEESDDKDSNFEIEDLSDLLALKKILVGGKKEELTSGEVVDLLKNLPTLSLIVFDAYYSKKETFGGEIGLYREYRRLISEFQTIFINRAQDEVVFTKDDLYELAKYAADYKDDDDLDEDEAKAFADAFFTIKDHAISKGDDSVLVSDIDPIAFYGKLALEGIASGGKIFDLIDEESRSIQERRIEAQSILNEAQEEMESLYSNRAHGLPEFDLKKMIKELADDLEEVDDLFVDLDLIELGVPLKKVIIGGTRTNFNMSQLQLLIEKIQSIGMIAFDFAEFDTDNYENDQDMYSFLINLINKVKTHIFKFANEEYEVIFPLHELVKFADKATDNEYNIGKFEETIDVIITKFIKGSAGKLTIKDIRSILNYGLELAEGGSYYEVAYAKNESKLNKNIKLKPKDMIKVSAAEVPEISLNPVSYYQREFGILVRDLRLYRTKDGDHHYGHKIVRTKYGLTEASLFRFAAKKLLEGYCAGDNPDPEKCGVDADQLNLFLNDFKPLLEEVKLWSANIQSFANNCLYLMDLFQTVSDGNMKIGIREGTEYIALILSAIRIGDDILEGLDKRCANQTVGDDQEREDEPTYLMKCFRDNVLDIWMNEYGYKNYLTAFNSYLKNASSAEVENLVIYLEQFVKDEPDSPIMNKRWITLFAGAILNVESMLIRFDTNEDNFLNPNEVDSAYEVYKTLIIDLGELSGSKERFAKSAFKYMVKEMKFPGVKDVLIYHFNPFASKKVSAERIHIASILNYFATM